MCSRRALIDIGGIYGIVRHRRFCFGLHKFNLLLVCFRTWLERFGSDDSLLDFLENAYACRRRVTGGEMFTLFSMGGFALRLQVFDTAQEDRRWWISG